MKLVAVHEIRYGDGQVAVPGIVFDASAEDAEFLVRVGAARAADSRDLALAALASGNDAAVEVAEEPAKRRGRPKKVEPEANEDPDEDESLV
jgi:hypothetical protein